MCPNIWNFPHFQKFFHHSLRADFVLILISRHEYVLRFINSHFWLISLKVTNKISVFFSIVCTLPPNIIKSLALSRAWCAPYSFKPSWLTWTLWMTYHTAKLKSNGRKSSPFSNYSYRKNISKCFLPGLCRRFHSNTFSLVLPVCWGYQNEWEYFMKQPSQINLKLYWNL